MKKFTKATLTDVAKRFKDRLEEKGYSPSQRDLMEALVSFCYDANTEGVLEGNKVVYYALPSMKMLDSVVKGLFMSALLDKGERI